MKHGKRLSLKGVMATCTMLVLHSVLLSALPSHAADSDQPNATPAVTEPLSLDLSDMPDAVSYQNYALTNCQPRAGRPLQPCTYEQ
ncbi:hypothetical protein FHW19_004525 [Ochrobactrum anthropi]|nr:hypothetical protein [Brucella anthropi]